MAALLSLVFILGMSVANAVSVVAETKADKAAASVIRRENQAIQLDASGKMQSSKDRLDRSRPSQCNSHFLLLAAGANDCVAPMHEIESGDHAECRRAAALLGKAHALAADFVVQPSTENGAAAILTFPKGCFLSTTDDIVYMNEQDSSMVPTNANGETEYSMGQKICMEPWYRPHVSTVATGAASKGPDCDAAESQPVESAEACWRASACVGGGTVSRHVDFHDWYAKGGEDDTPHTVFNVYISQERPKGCFQDHFGEWNFNFITAAATGTIEDGTPVCLLLASAGVVGTSVQGAPAHELALTEAETAAQAAAKGAEAAA